MWIADDRHIGETLAVLCKFQRNCKLWSSLLPASLETTLVTCCCDKIPLQSSRRKKGLISVCSAIWFIVSYDWEGMVEEIWSPGYIISTVRKDRQTGNVSCLYNLQTCPQWLTSSCKFFLFKTLQPYKESQELSAKCSKTLTLWEYSIFKPQQKLYVFFVSLFFILMTALTVNFSV